MYFLWIQITRRQSVKSRIRVTSESPTLPSQGGAADEVGVGTQKLQFCDSSFLK